MGRSTRLAACVFLAAACARRSPPTPTSIFLGDDVARVGQVAITPGLVAAVARAHGVSPRDALDSLVEDGLAAESAKARGFEHDPAVEWATHAALARAHSMRLHDQARSIGPPEREELARIRVVHAVVLRSSSLGKARAVAAAEAVRREVERARDENEFEVRAKASSPVAITVERLPEFDASGRMEQGELDPTFVTAAFAMRHTGETSPVVETDFGWHVIRLVSRAVPEDAFAAQQAAALSDAVIALRTRTLIDGVLRARRQRLPVDVSAAADELMSEAFAAAP